ncbi:Hypothetical protein EIN_153560, partial [Entamoeba invadens IP1]
MSLSKKHLEIPYLINVLLHFNFETARLFEQISHHCGQAMIGVLRNPSTYQV